MDINEVRIDLSEAKLDSLQSEEDIQREGRRLFQIIVAMNALEMADQAYPRPLIPSQPRGATTNAPSFQKWQEDHRLYRQNVNAQMMAIKDELVARIAEELRSHVSETIA